MCDEIDGQTARSKAERSASFYESIDSKPLADPPYDIECIAENFDQIERQVDRYCGRRASTGHDAHARELHDLEFEFSMLALHCESEREAPFYKRIGKPIYCRDIEALLRDSIPVLAPISSERQLQCMEEAIPAVSAELESECAVEPIPGPHALSYLDVLAARCPVKNREATQ